MQAVPDRDGLDAAPRDVEAPAVRDGASRLAPSRRWLVLLTAAVMLAMIMGMLVNGLSAFFIPVERSTGWARGELALINSFGLIGIALGSMVMGFLGDRLPIRAIGIMAAGSMGACLVAASQVDALWQAYAIFLLAGVVGGGALFAPIFATVGNWFPTMAGLAIGVAASGQAIGQGGMPFLASVLIEAMGWREAMLTLGIATLAILTPMALVLRDPPARPASAQGAEAWPLPPALVIPALSLAVFLCCTCMAVPLMHLMPLMQGLCIAPTDAGRVLFVMLMAAIIGRIGFGRLCDVIGPLPSWLLSSLWQTAGAVAFTQFATLGAFTAFAIAYGLGYSGVMTSVLVTVRALTPPAQRTSAMGVILAFAWLGHGLGGYQGAALFDATGSYFPGFAAASIAGLLNLVLVATLLHLASQGRRRAAGT